MVERGIPGGEEFYIGYLNPVPRGYARRVRGAVLWLAVLVAGVAAAVAKFQGDAGDARWESDPTEMTGLFMARPYPVLMVEGQGEPPRAVILVGAGKCGAFEPSGYCGLLGGGGASATGHEAARRAAMRLFDGKLVRVRGTKLHRNGRMMVELEETDRAVVAAAQSPELIRRLRPGAGEEAARILVGRVVDSKCYLGAMKPGDGKTHRACAVRCISGGIPPMLVVGEDYFLLADASGEPMNEAILPFVGDRIEVSGRIGRLGPDIAVFLADPSSIRRR